MCFISLLGKHEQREWVHAMVKKRSEEFQFPTHQSADVENVELARSAKNFWFQPIEEPVVSWDSLDLIKWLRFSSALFDHGPIVSGFLIRYMMAFFSCFVLQSSLDCRRQLSGRAPESLSSRREARNE
jgi:hypothetical protein